MQIMAAKSSTPSFILELPVITFVFIKNTAPAIWELAKKEKESDFVDESYAPRAAVDSLKGLYIMLYIVSYSDI